jgi:hypothetical protein
MTGWLVPSGGQKIPLAENRFLFFKQVRELKIQRKKKKSRQCFTYRVRPQGCDLRRQSLNKMSRTLGD